MGAVRAPLVRGFRGRDGVALAYREIGEGRPLVLLHGFLATGLLWLDNGPAPTLAAHGHRIVAPDLRGHGDSARPHAPAAYPPDVLADDGLALIEALGLDDYDLGGYSLGGRVVLRMLVRGARPRRAIVGGQGLDALDPATGRTGGYRRVLTAVAAGEALEPGSPDAELARWIGRLGADPVALLRVLDTYVATHRSALRGVRTPTLVAVGDRDDAHASADALAAALPHGRLVRVPGDHATALAAPALAEAIVGFLSAPA